VEQLASLRAIPELIVIRPADANETAVAWEVAVSSHDRPVLLVLTRQNVPTLDRHVCRSADGVRQGAYILRDAVDERPKLILMASGSEVSLILAAAERLAQEGIAVRCVSMPCFELFDALPEAARHEVLPPAVTARVAVEMASPQGWEKYTGDRGIMLGINRFGASAKASVLLREFGFTPDHVCAVARNLCSAY
jgi:transketolase